MKITKQMIGVVALLGSSASMAATVNIVASNENPGIGDQFTITIAGAGFPQTAGATLGLLYDNTVVSYVSGALPATGPWTAAGGSFFLPHSGPGTPVAGTANPAATFDILAPSSGTPPSGSFDAALVFTFQAIAPGAAGIQIIDNEETTQTLLWVDAVTFEAIPTTTTQANVNVVPLPATAWLIAPAILAAGRFSRRRKAA